MSQITVNLPTLTNWRTTLFGLITAVGGALMAQYQTGAITWQVAVACSLWTVFCYLVPDAKSNTQAQAQIAALLSAVSNLQTPAPIVAARSDAPATDAAGLPAP